VRGHVGDALAAVAQLIRGADVEGRVVGRAGGAVAPRPPAGLGGVGGTGLLLLLLLLLPRRRRGHGQRRDDRAVQAGGAAGEVPLTHGAAVRPILRATVVLQAETLGF